MSLSLADALKLIDLRCAPIIGIEPIAIDAALSRVLAQPFIAPIDVPACDNSAVDGYGFRHVDLVAAREGGLTVVGIAAAGRNQARAVGPGEAVRIYTGAAPPTGVDAIAMQEDAVGRGERVSLSRDIPLHANIRRKGEDIAAGAQVFAPGRRLGPFELGMLASLGVIELAVRRRLRVAVLSAGDELIDPGEQQRTGAVYDANRPTLLALLRRMDIAVTDLGIMPDDKAVVRSTLSRAAARHDAVVTSAGVSVGDEDHLRAAVETLGELDFASVAIKPGKPFAFGHIAGTPFFGLPGNPVAMVLTFLLLARPGLLSLAGDARGPPARFPVELGFCLRRNPGRREFLRCSLREGSNGPIADRFARGGSGILSSLADSGGLIEIAEDVTDAVAGIRFPFIPFGEFSL